MKIVVLNSGSSSQKSCLYDIGKTLPEYPPAPVWEGKIEWDGNHADIQVRNSQGAHLEDRVEVASRSDAIVQLHTPMKGVKHCKHAKVGSLSLGLHASF